MLTPVMPMPQSFFSTSGALMPMPRARSAIVIVSSMRMTRLCSAGVVSVRLLALLAEGQLLAPKSLPDRRATAGATRADRAAAAAARTDRGSD